MAAFGTEGYITRTAALQRISQGSFRQATKTAMAEIINAVHTFGGLYNLGQAVSNGDKSIPSSWRDLQSFRNLLKKIRSLGFHPATVPDSFASGRYSELPSLYELLQQKTQKNLSIGGNKNGKGN